MQLALNVCLLLRAGPISPGNGDFIGLISNASTWPSFQQSFFGTGVPAVVFNVTTDGIADRLYANQTAFPHFDSFFGASDWSVEFWAYNDGWMASTGENRE